MRLPNVIDFIKTKDKGFTLIELLIVIAIITALGITVFAALNPSTRIINANDARRTTDADTILTSIHQSIVDNKGTLPTGLSTGMLEVQLGTGAAGACSPLATGGCSVAASTACLDMSTTLNKYLKSVPIDPTVGTAASTKYSVIVDANNIVTVKACGVQGTTNISVSR